MLSKGIHDSFSPSVSVVRCIWKVFWETSKIVPEFVNIICTNRIFWVNFIQFATSVMLSLKLHLKVCFLYGAVSSPLDRSIQYPVRWPSGLERWLGLATGRSRPGSNPTAENFASELWQFRLPRFASVFRRRH